MGEQDREGWGLSLRRATPRHGGLFRRRPFRAMRTRPPRPAGDGDRAPGMEPGRMEPPSRTDSAPDGEVTVPAQKKGKQRVSCENWALVGQLSWGFRGSEGALPGVRSVFTTKPLATIFLSSVHQLCARSETCDDQPRRGGRCWHECINSWRDTGTGRDPRAGGAGGSGAPPGGGRRRRPAPPLRRRG